MLRLVCLLVLIPFFGFAQDLILENNPPHVKWKQINTPGIQLIFPASFEGQANTLANKLEQIRAVEGETMSEAPPKKISIILQNKSSISNGFVTLGPRRSEFQTMPPQDYNFIGINQWLDMLAVHEYRHIVQFQHSKTGWNKLFYYLFGQNTQAGMAAVAAPDWFWEGDAVATETALTHSGRGRMPSFNRTFRTNLLEGKRYSYNKQHLRSYKDFVPNHYVLGYHMVTHLRRNERANIWGEVSHDAFSWPFIPFTFSNALKKNRGKYLVPTYEEMMDDLDSVWSNQLKNIKPTQFVGVNNRKSDVFTEYYYPQQLANGKIVAYKTGIGDVGQVVVINNDGTEETAFITGPFNDSGMLSVRGNKLVWVEYRFDPRWRAKNYSVVKIYDFDTQRATTLTHKSRYVSAAISPDEKKIVAATTSEEGLNYIAIIDINTGEEVKRIGGKSNVIYSMPRWVNNGQVVVGKIYNEGKEIVRVDVETEQEVVLMPHSSQNVGHQVVMNDYLLYNSPISGVDNIYARKISTGQVYQVVSSKYGAYNPSLSVDGKWLYYNEYTVNGMDVVKVRFSPEQWKPFDEVLKYDVKYYQPLIDQEQKEDLLLHTPEVAYISKKYSKAGHMFNVHSWGPYATTDLTKAQVGVFSRDVLSTTNASLGYTYDVEEEVGYGAFNLSYQGWYPVVDLEVTKGDRSTKELLDGEDTRFNWTETTADLGVRLPLLLTKSAYLSELSLSSKVGLVKVEDFNQSVRFIDQQANGDLYTLNTGLSYYRLLKQSTRDIYSKWGQSIWLNYTSTPFGGDYVAGQLSAYATSYFPGLFKHHSLYLRGSFQHRKWDYLSQSQALYILRNQVFLPRGYSHNTWQDFTTLSANYALPLCYPDFSIGPLVNIKRIRTNLFYDYGYAQLDYVTSDGNPVFRSSDFNSFGADFLFDINILRFPTEVSLGARISYAKPNDYNSGGSKFELLISNISF